MKTTLKILLVVAAVGLVYVSTMSILRPIEFDKERAVREKAIIQRLMDIRTAQIQYKQQHGVHAANFGELVDFLEHGKIPTVLKVGELTEKQLEDGLTEQEAVKIIQKAREKNDWKEAKEKGLVYGPNEYFRRDTTWNEAGETLFGNRIDFSKFGTVPGTNVTFEMDTASIKTASGYNIAIFEAKVPYQAYLGDMDKGMLINLEDKADKLEKYPGLKVGSLEEINNYAGNWETEY